MVNNGRLALFLATVLGAAAGCDRSAERQAEKAATGRSDTAATGRADKAADETPPDPNKPPADAEKRASGLITKVLAPGTGEKTPRPYDKVRVHFTEWGAKGKKRDTWQEGGGPVTFEVSGVVRGWTEALQLMKVGEKRRLWVPDALGYPGRPGPPRAPTVFDIELVEIVEGAAPVPAPPDVAAPPPDATETASGLVYKVLRRSGGDDDARPNPWDRVTLNYTGWTAGGEMFDTSRKRERPAIFDMGDVLPGWAEGLAQMSPGDRVRMWVPQALAYQGRTGQPQGTLVFDIELLAIERRPQPPAAPPDVAAPPKNARKTASGLAYRILEKGQGKHKPEPTSRVRVHYAAWTTDGKLFDSSQTRGRPASFRVDRVIPGWREGLQLMKVGDKARFWIPEPLAYKGAPGAPPGMLVYDVELLEIVRDPTP